MPKVIMEAKTLAAGEPPMASISRDIPEALSEVMVVAT